MIGRIWSDFGPLDGLVNNAAGNFVSRTQDVSPRGFDAVAGIVLHGTYYATHHVGRRWIAERPQGLGDLDRRHLGAHRRALRRALGDEQGRRRRDDQVAGHRMGPLRHPAQRHRAGHLSDRRRQRAAEPEGGVDRRQRAQPDEPARPHERAAEPGGVPDGRRRGMADRRNHRHRRRRPPPERRFVHRAGRAERRAMARDARGHPRPGPARQVEMRADADGGHR